MEDQNDRESTLEIKETSFYCPWCGKYIPADSVYCGFCGKYIPEEVRRGLTESEEAEPANQGNLLKKAGRISASHKKAIIIGSFVILMAFLLVIFINGIGTGAKTKTEAMIFYIKDNSLYGGMKTSGALKSEGENLEYSSSYLAAWSSRSGGGILNEEETLEESKEGTTGGTTPARSESGQYLFYMEQGEADVFDLSRTKLSTQETKTLDSGVVEFLPVGSDQVIYKKENQAVYLYDGSRKSRLFRSASDYLVSRSRNAVLWTTEEDGTNDIYYQMFSEGSEKVRLERDAELLHASPELDTILVQKDNTVYRIDQKGNKEALAEEVSSIVGADALMGTFYFVREVSPESGSPYKELYYYAKGKTSLLEDSLEEILWEQGNTLLYKRVGEERDFLLASGGTVGGVGREIALTEKIEIDGERLYFLSPDEAGVNHEPQYELCYTTLTGKRLGKVETVDRMVSELACIYDSRAYYFKNVVDGIGDLYCDGELSAYDVAVGSVAGIPGSSRVLCIADSSRARMRGMLTMVGDGKSEAIADQVYGYSAVAEQEILLLSEYNREKGRGDLLFYDGQKVKTIERDIWGYYEIGSSGSLQ